MILRERTNEPARYVIDADHNVSRFLQRITHDRLAIDGICHDVPPCLRDARLRHSSRKTPS